MFFSLKTSQFLISEVALHLKENLKSRHCWSIISEKKVRFGHLENVANRICDENAENTAAALIVTFTC